MDSCPACHRPLAVARATCVYCGALLGPAAATPGAPDAATRPADAGAPPAVVGDGAPRALVVLEVEGASARALADALALPSYEVALLVRRGGFHLHRVLAAGAAEEEAKRLATFGARVFVVPEAEARVRPLRALGGERTDGVLTLRTEEEPVTLRRGGLLLVVQGPITREYQPSARRRRVDTAQLDEGYRVHLHPRRPAGPARPVEVDAATFEFGPWLKGSGRIELDLWVEEILGGAPCDGGFRRLPPALGPAEPEPKGAVAAAGTLGLAARRRGRREAPLVLDNVAQFRFYSGWRAAVQRRLTRPAGTSS
jgi:hypothetical protein